MDQTSGKGSRLRRILPYGLAGVGAYAAIAYGGAVFNAPAPPAHTITTADQMISAAAPLPAAAPVQLPTAQNPVTGTVGQVQSIGHDVLPADAAAATRGLSSAATATMIPSSAAGMQATGAAQAPAGPLSAVPLVGNLPLVSSLNSVPLQNVTGSGLTQPLSGLTSGATSGASSQPLKNVLPGVAGLSLPQVNGATPLSGLLP